MWCIKRQHLVFLFKLIRCYYSATIHTILHRLNQNDFFLINGINITIKLYMCNYILIKLYYYILLQTMFYIYLTIILPSSANSSKQMQSILVRFLIPITANRECQMNSTFEVYIKSHILFEQHSEIQFISI